MDLLSRSRLPMQLMFGVLLTISPAHAQTEGAKHARQLVAEGALFIQEGRLSEAADRFRKAMKTDPNNADAPNDLGVVLRRQKNFEEAVLPFHSALRLQTEEERLYHKFALALQQLRRISASGSAMK